tara:strand:- start:2966 stop:3304 length:339 start_codon:yes stop_codon:yes gene_type:complete
MTWENILKEMSADYMRKTIKQILEGKYALGHGGMDGTDNFNIEYYAKVHKVKQEVYAHQLKIIGDKGTLYKALMRHKDNKLIVEVDKLDSLLAGDIKELMSMLSKMKRRGTK